MCRTSPLNCAIVSLHIESLYSKFQPQLQLQQNIRLGSPPLVITGKKLEDAGAVSEDDGLPRSPPEMSTLHEVLTVSPNKV